ncbi:MAG TPA: transcription termination/antitermination protein NusG [Cyclobacteriaceae bacterium]
MEQIIKWHAVYTKPRSEKKVAERLIANGYHAYCPLIKTMRQWSDRKKKVYLPMLPSYVLINVKEKQRADILKDPGVLNFVFWQGKPAIIREEEINYLQKIEDKGRDIKIDHHDLIQGSEMSIQEGPFKGLTGIVDKFDNQKVYLNIQSLGLRISFKFNEDSLTPS